MRKINTKNYHPHCRETVVKVRCDFHSVQNGWYRVHECKLDNSLTLVPATDAERDKAKKWFSQRTQIDGPTYGGVQE